LKQVKNKAVMSTEELQRAELKAHSIERRLPFSQLPLGIGSSTNGRVMSSSPGVRPLVACVTPTPQVEQGLLSPTPMVSRSPIITSGHGTTPRIPLAELDSTQLSQRLFHSPGPSSLSHTQPSPSASMCQIPSSPSQLLLTQAPQSGNQHRERRHQLNTERQLVELRQQVEQLGTMMASRGSGHASVLEQRLDQLEQEREELDALLEERDGQLGAMKDSVAALNAEYMADLETVRVECGELARSVEHREEAYSRLEIEHQKSLKTIKGLEAYIRTLPSVEDFREVKAKLEAKSSHYKDSEARLEDAEKTVRSLRSELQSVNKEKLRLEIDNQELEARNKEMGSQVEGGERRRLQARELDGDQVQLLLFDKQDLKNENEKLKTVLDWKTKKFEDEKNKLEDQVRNYGKLLEKTNKQLQVNSTQLRETNSTKNLLEVDLKKKTDMVSSLSSKLDRVGMEVKTLRGSNQTTSQLDGHFTRLTRCMSKCVTELHSLTDLCSSVMGGGNPNTSVLLGTRDLGLLSPVSSLDRDLASLSHEEKLEVVREQMREMTRLQTDLKELRSKIADKYSESLADNMSCITQ